MGFEAEMGNWGVFESLGERRRLPVSDIGEFSPRGLRRPLGARVGEGSGEPSTGEERGEERGNGTPLKDGDPRRLTRNFKGGMAYDLSSSSWSSWSLSPMLILRG